MSTEINELDKKIEKAVLVSLITGKESEKECYLSLDELEQLLITAGGSVYARLVQSRQKPEKATYLGTGKLQELKELCKAGEVDLVVFDCELTPSQINNIENELENTRVIDRTMLILDIFAQNATTAEGILQVEIANLRYTLPRLVGKGLEMSRLGGGIGTRGPGESKLETDKRHIKRKIIQLEKELEGLAEKRAVQRKSRVKNGIFQIAVAGYTNAGKSTLMNTLCDAGILAEDNLFATLDPTTRRLKLPRFREVLLTDTVGFIRRLPHHLVEAFKSTLDEVVFADLVLVVTDASDREFLNRLEVTDNILNELYEKRGLSPAPRIYVLNKCDRPESRFNTEFFPFDHEKVEISALTGTGLDKLIEKIEDILEKSKKTCKFRIPAEKGALVSLLYKTSNILNVEYDGDFTIIEAVCDEKTRGQLNNYLV